jgi:hypothetical protein
MSSPAQLAANRRNAQKSTGPRTSSGKAASRMNAMDSGLYAHSLVIRGEDPDALNYLTAEYHQEFRPVTPRERDLVDAMVRNEWIIRRMGYVEAELWGHFFKRTDCTLPGSRFDALDREFPLGQAFQALSRDFERLQRRVTALDRNTRRALQELAELRAQRESDPDDHDAFAESAADPEPAALPAPQPIESEAVSIPIGFVPSNPAAPDSLTPNPQPLTPAERSAASGFVPLIFPIQPQIPAERSEACYSR